MIRTTKANDTPTLLEITRGTGVFKPHEVDALKEVLDDYFAANHLHGHRAVTYEKDGHILGYAYFAPAAMTDNTWYLYWIAVTKNTQAKGIGGVLLRHAEDEIKKAGGRVLFIETSSLPHYTQTRRFYEKHGYEVTGVLRDYYTDGDDMVVFRKRLAG